MKFDCGIIIGRFQPFHRGHFDLIEKTLQKSQVAVIVLGSANAARNIRNPFTTGERQEMMEKNFESRPDLKSRIKFVEVRDYFYNNPAWTNEVTEKIKSASPTSKSFGLFGFTKDQTSSYLKWFPEWSLEEVPFLDKINATPLRENYLREAKSVESSSDISAITKDWLKSFSKTDFYRQLHEEQTAIDKYKADWASAPYPPVFVTTDVLVIQAGHILLIRRNGTPGKGLWANPGGFLDPHERLQECAIRELMEETQIEVSREELEKSLVAVKTFDHPLRSVRGRTITHAHLFKLPGDRLAKMKASDDAADAKWIPILDLAKMEDQFFEDHFHIIQNMIKTY